VNVPRAPESYELPDPELRAYDHGVGTLSIGGELVGHLASVVGRITFPSLGLWPWFLVVWLDGTRENPFEDYGPKWLTVRELDAGYLEYHGPSTRAERRFLGMRDVGSRAGSPVTYEFAWLPADEAQRKWDELGLGDADF
jgi:hypothetical protein